MSHDGSGRGINGYEKLPDGLALGSGRAESPAKRNVLEIGVAPDRDARKRVPLVIEGFVFRGAFDPFQPKQAVLSGHQNALSRRNRSQQNCTGQRRRFQHPRTLSRNEEKRAQTGQEGDDNYGRWTVRKVQDVNDRDAAQSRTGQVGGI